MSALAYRKLRAPEADGAALIDPWFESIVPIAQRNREALFGLEGAEIADSAADGTPKYKFLDAVRAEFLINAKSHTPGTCGPDRQSSHCPGGQLYPLQNHIVIAGHQPELFHPGVWFKNFLLSHIRTQFGPAVVNVLIDNDVVRRPAISVPVWNGKEPRLESIPFDAPDPLDSEVPWEERPIRDWSIFESFGDRVAEAVASWPRSVRKQPGPPLIGRLWPHAIRFAREAQGIQQRLGAILAGARRLLEFESGVMNTEYPLSQVAITWSFRGIALLWLARMPLVQEQYNDALAAYRVVNRIRSASHPVPPLARDGDWYEAPYWMWTIHDPRRRRLFVRQRGTEVELTDRGDVRIRLNASENGSGCEQWDEHERAGIKIRPRALVTTMYLRCYLSDLFIHGIGGAKYDELTDEIIRRFFGIEPPRYVTATATFRLPIERPNVSIKDVRAAARLVRDVRYRPETLVGHPLVAGDAGLERELQALAAEKREYLRTHTPRRAPHEVFAGLDRLNASMADMLQPLERHLRAEHVRLVELLKRSRMLGSREFSFVLFPEDYLVPRLLALAAGEK